jgi:hypothetical protein
MLFGGVEGIVGISGTKILHQTWLATKKNRNEREKS